MTSDLLRLLIFSFSFVPGGGLAYVNGFGFKCTFLTQLALTLSSSNTFAADESVCSLSYPRLIVKREVGVFFCDGFDFLVT